MSSRYKQYQYSAERRGYTFELTEEQFDKLGARACVYCGHPAEGGVDRYDNRKGYTVENSVPCDTLCNKLKGTFHGDDFFTLIKHIYIEHRYDEKFRTG